MMPSHNNYTAWVYGSLQRNAARFCTTERGASEPNPLRWDVCLWPSPEAASDSLKGGRSKRWPQDVYVLALLVAHKTPYLHSPGSLVDEDAHIVSARHGVCCDVP